MPRRVVKIGGSLLTMPDVAIGVERWLDRQPAASTLIVVGGGPPVDSIRELAELFPYPQEMLHWLCVDLLDASFRLMHAQQSRWLALDTYEQLQTHLESREAMRGSIRALVRVGAFYNAQRSSRLPLELPVGWQTTTDSIAALLAHICKADELVLLKSCPIPDQLHWDELVRSGVVDEAFPAAISGLPGVRLENLRQ